MFSHRVFTTDFRTALEEELERKDMSIKELAERAGIPAATLYKITSGERDPRFSTVKAIADALDPRERDFVAVIGVKFLLDELQGTSETAGGKTYRIRGYTANTMEECIIAAVRAEKDGAAGIICAPILSTLVERIVDIPVTIIKPNPESYVGAFESIVRMIE
ncbi:MAG TPA: helix-turn-helix domain-containing protein [Methanoculleus sp.]|nr:helix-turn-helix domain-containing protein [Methanoculleus sp.]